MWSDVLQSRPHLKFGRRQTKGRKGPIEYSAAPLPSWYPVGLVDNLELGSVADGRGGELKIDRLERKKVKQATQSEITSAHARAE